jgi:plastocyanin
MIATIKWRAIGFAAGAALLLAAAAVPAQQPAAAASGRRQIAIDNFAFVPATVTVAAGTEIIWVNHDEEPHTVNSIDTAAAFKSPALDTGDKFTFVYTKAGRYTYFCSIHPHMVGTIIVK